MPTQEVARAARPSAWLQRDPRRPRPILLDGGGADSWSNGDVIYSDSPSATLTVWPSGWGCWREAAGEHWRWGDPLEQWRDFTAHAEHVDPERGGGVLTALSYDLKHWIERLPRRHPWPRLPVLYAARYDWSYRANHATGGARLAAGDAALLAERCRWLAEQTDGSPASSVPPPSVGRGCPRPALGRRGYVAMVERAHQYIAAGDVYEINLAQCFVADLTAADAPSLCRAWARHPMPFAAYVDAGPWVLVSNSPECLLTVRGRSVATFPIKGTRRYDAQSAPGAVAAALRADPKEQAEHVMVVDLERNDLGRVCVPGSITIAELATVRHYPALAHMVSAIRGRLRDDVTHAALLRAMFPGGSITGAPKVRALQLIEELEPRPRAFYTGAIGWSDAEGMRVSIAIRTALLDAEGSTYWAGGGIVADSDAGREYDETLLKSETFFRALASLERRTA